MYVIANYRWAKMYLCWWLLDVSIKILLITGGSKSLSFWLKQMTSDKNCNFFGNMSCLVLHIIVSRPFKRNNSYYFSRANQQKAGTKIYSLTQCSLTVNECDWHILAGNDERINSYCLTGYNLCTSIHIRLSFLNLCKLGYFGNFWPPKQFPPPPLLSRKIQDAHTNPHL